MTALLQKAFRRISTLLPNEQGDCARQLLKELDSEKRLDELFDLTADEQ